ncbi:hypothetical protein EV193_104133 [Herbihabitans rhizosphaerae]|uniref:Uncharacterized protein n=1 Tax=Herbihabitans rhizosphaerae TaxID=1872711 RepID=A0A4Q7KTZ4_9PSEU|nr:hypothetical protein [Herbihabitans rhizosphaerae]RZS38922.1 hypothetical protein EV193_104133 [Herbihabitans rhizosphaerae]
MTEQEAGTRLAEEIGLLLDAVADRAGPWLDRVAASTHDEHAGQSDVDGEPTRPVACGWCPLCSVIALLRGEPSELAGKAVERAAELIALLRAVLADRWEPGTTHMPGFRPPPREREPAYTAESTSDSRERPRVQRIPIRRT